MQFINLPINSNTLPTVLLYAAIVLLSSLLAFRCQKNVCRLNPINGQLYPIKRIFRKNYFVASFVVLWFFSAFNYTGVDKLGYINIFRDITWDTLLTNNQELGFNLLNLFFKTILPSPKAFLCFLSTLTLILVFSSFYYFRNHIKIGYAVLSYTCMFYFQSFSLMRIYFASAIILFGLRYLMRDKHIKFLISLFIAFSMHFSAIIFLLPYLIFLFFRFWKSSVRNKTIFLIVGVAALFILFVLSIEILPQLNIFKRYDYIFANLKYQGIGLMQFIYHAPLILAGLCLCSCKKQNTRLTDISLITTYISLFFGLLAYSVPVGGRLNILANSAFILFLPYFMDLLKKSPAIYRKSNRSLFGAASANYNWIAAIVILILFARFIIYLGEYWFLDGINEFLFLWKK